MSNPPVMSTTYHINGLLEASGCTGCHGNGVDKEYPPLAAVGTDRNTANGVGAHVKHIESTAGLLVKQDSDGDSAANDEVDDWCTECHTTTRGAGGHDDAYPAEVFFTNAIEAKYTGADGGVTFAFTEEDTNENTGTGSSPGCSCRPV